MTEAETRLKALLLVHGRGAAGGAGALLGTSFLTPASWGNTVMPGVVSGLEGVTALLQAPARGDPPDLVIVDCSPRPEVAPGDPMPLVYAAAAAARMLDLGRPFGFAHYGSSWHSLSESPVAVEAYALLRAAAGGPRLSAVEARAAMRSEKALFSPANVLPAVLEGYRAALLDAVGTEVFPDSRTFDGAADRVAKAGAGAVRWTRDTSIRWTANGARRDVLVVSLFADMLGGTEWGSVPDRARGKAAEYLKEVARRARWFEDLVDRAVRGFLADDRESVAAYGRGQDGYRAKVVALVARWAVQRIETPKDDASRTDVSLLLGALGLSEIPRSQRGIMDRAVQNVFPGKLTTESLVDLLDRAEAWPFPDVAWLQEAVRSVLEQLSGSGGRYAALDAARWPRCLRRGTDRE